MKKVLFLFIYIISLSTNGQVLDPLSQFFNNTFIPNIVAHDSITVSADSGSLFSAIAVGYQDYFINGKIDTLTITQGGSVVAYYKGKVYNNFHYTSVTGYSLTQNDSIDKLVFIQDQNYLDSVVSYFEYQNGSFVKFFEARINRDSNKLPTVIDIFADIGTGLVKIGDYQYFYNQGLLDSLYYTVTLGGQNDGFLRYNYDTGVSGKLLTVDTYEDVNNDGEKDFIRQFICKNNPQNEVVEITELNADNNFNLLLSGAFRFDIQANSTISLNETAASKISLYPNPTADYLMIDYNPNQLDVYTIIDMNGKSIIHGDLDKQIDVSALPIGVFQIIINGKSKVSSTFIKK